MKKTNEKNHEIFTNDTLGKGDFIQSVMRKDGFDMVRMLKYNDDEWQAEKNFRNIYFFDPCGIKDPYTLTFNNEEHVHLVLYQVTEIIGYTNIQFWPDKRSEIRIIVVN